MSSQPIMSDFDRTLIQSLRSFLYEKGPEVSPGVNYPSVPVTSGGQTGHNPFSSEKPRLNPPPRQSLTGNEVVRLYEATQFMMLNFGVAFNAHMTVQWRHYSVHTHQRAAEVLTKFNKELAAWLRVGEKKPKIRVTQRALFGASPHFYAYVHELGAVHGLHSHQLMVIPPDKAAAFELWARSALLRLAGRYAVRPEAVHFSPCTKRDGFRPPMPDSDRAVATAWRWFRYIIKSVPTSYGCFSDDGVFVRAREIFRPFPSGGSGPIYLTKLAGTSENIGPAARDAAGFRSKYLDGRWGTLYDGTEIAECRRRQKDRAESLELEYVLSRLKI